MPGPGSYNIDSKPSGPKVTIAGKYEEKDKNLSPGPKYDPLISSKESYKFTIRGKPKEIMKKDTPGPGTYEFELLRPSKSAISFGTSHRKSLIEVPKSPLPGPGTYEYPSVPISERKGPRYSYFIYSKDRFGKSEEKRITTSTMPGPGTYDTKPIIGSEGIKPTISSRVAKLAPTKSLTTPGPGTYAPGINKYKAPAYKLGTAKRTKDEQTKDNIGPGSYNPSYRISEINLPKWK